MLKLLMPDTAQDTTAPDTAPRAFYTVEEARALLGARSTVVFRNWAARGKLEGITMDSPRDRGPRKVLGFRAADLHAFIAAGRVPQSMGKKKAGAKVRGRVPAVREGAQ